MCGYAAVRLAAPRPCMFGLSMARTGAPGICSPSRRCPTPRRSRPSTTIACTTNQWSQVTSWISYSDADGNAATQYQFWDSGTDASSGYFWTPTMRIMQPVTDDHGRCRRSCNVWVRGGPERRLETMWVRAFDGTDWSAWDLFTLPRCPTPPPVATINDHSLHTNEWSQVQNWISLLGRRWQCGDAVRVLGRRPARTAAISGRPTMRISRPAQPSRSLPPILPMCGFAAVRRRLRDHVGARLRRHRLERLGFVQLHDASQHRRRSRPSTTTACTPMNGRRCELALLLGRRRQRGDAVPVLGRRYRREQRLLLDADNAHHLAGTTIAVRLPYLANVWVRGGRSPARRPCGCAPSTAPTGAPGTRSN